MKKLYQDDYEIHVYYTKESDGSTSTEFEVYDETDRYIVSGWHDHRLTDSQVITKAYEALNGELWKN